MLHLISRALLLCALYAFVTCHASAQTPDVRPAANDPSAIASPPSSVVTAAGSELEEVRRWLREQQEEIKRMRAFITEQSRLIEELRNRLERTEQVAAGSVKAEDQTAKDTTTEPQASRTAVEPSQEARLDRLEEQVKRSSEALAKQLGSISFSGDIRLRYESFYGQLNDLPNSSDPAVLGNELSTRQRFRVRARLAIHGQVGKEFDWGLRLATGSFANPISINQTLTDFYNRKPFGLDQAYIAWTPRRLAGLRVQGGKFDTPWLHTEMTIDNDLQPEGFNETYSRGFKDSILKNLTIVAWQLPFLERSSAFVRNPNGTVQVDESRRAGRDLALYGAQLRTRFEPAPHLALTLSVADLYFSGTQFITPVQFFGSQLQLPVTITIPATANSPAQTLTTTVSISRDQLVAGNSNLGISTATNNAINRDGRLASGFNLIDVIGRLELNRSKRYPVMLLFNFVTNTQAHPVSVNGPGGASLFLRNDENQGYWAELLVGNMKERGDVQFGYTFIRIEKDAVLTPFNFSDLAEQSDVRAHRFVFNYTADPRVTLSLTAIISQRPHGLLGAFETTPPGSLNRPTTRLQFDTVFRF